VLILDIDIIHFAMTWQSAGNRKKEPEVPY
jgi:hypothetical protein